MNTTKHEGSCLCGSVKLEVLGAPATAGICHCESCRIWHAAPFNAWTLWKNENVRITQGEALATHARVRVLSVNDDHTLTISQV